MFSCPEIPDNCRLWENYGVHHYKNIQKQIQHEESLKELEQDIKQLESQS